MKFITPIFLTCSLLALPLALHADGQIEGAADKVDYLAMYRECLGEWDSTSKLTFPQGEESDAIDIKGQFVRKEILNGTMIEVKGYETVADKRFSFMWLITYDAGEELYIAWTFDERGAGNTFHGVWSEEEKAMNWTAIDPKFDMPVTCVDDLSDQNVSKFSSTLTGEDGNVVAIQKGSATRVKEE